MGAELRAEVRQALTRGLGRVRTHWAAGNRDGSGIGKGHVCAALAPFVDPVTWDDDPATFEAEGAAS
jgi:hypothetical protein